MNNNYNDDSIQALKGADRVRKRPGVMLGSDNIHGAFHTVKEIVGNSLDEARAGYGKLIEITYHKDKSISVRDYGRGVPLGFNKKENRWNWDLIFNELYAGGKYEEGNYKYSIGLNGLGAAVTQYTSEFFVVTSFKGNKFYRKRFRKGNPIDDGLEEGVLEKEEWGTLITWKIDNEVFPDTDFPHKMFMDYCEAQAHLNKVDIKLILEDIGEEYLYKGVGIEHYLKELLGDNIIDIIYRRSKSQGVELGNEYRAEAEIVLAITNECRSKHLYYHNTGEISFGMHPVAFRDAVMHFFKDIGKQRGVNIQPYDYQDYISVIVSSYSNITSFEGQTKNAVTNNFIYTLVYGTIKDMLEEEYAKGSESISTLVENVVTAAYARQKAKEAEAQARLIKRVTNRREEAEKFIACEEKDPKKRELLIVEGDSAAGCCMQGRDSKFQAILPVRGKTLNCLKASLDTIFDNQVIKDIIGTVGTGVELDGTEFGLFDINNLQYDKIIFVTDADIDGYQIRVLLYTVFYRLMPQLLEAGKVFIAETPLFELVTNKGSYYAYSLKERDNLLEKLKNEGIIVKAIHRSKGLGQNNPEKLWETTLNPETRKLIPLTMDTKEQIVRDITDMLFGLDPHNERKAFIFDMLEEEGLVDLIETVNVLTGEEFKLDVQEGV